MSGSRAELLERLSHDLRTPLASLRGYLDTLLLKDASLATEERRRFLQIAARQSEHLSELLADLLELARLDSPEFRIQIEAVQLAELAQDLVQERAASARGILLILEASGRIPMVRADIALMERGLRRLIQSAAGDRVVLALGCNADRVTVALTCRQVAGDDIVERILELHGSPLIMETFPERGTRLSFSLPIA